MPAVRVLAGRLAGLWGRLPLRIRLVAGFAAAMLLVLTGAGAFVYLRVQYALDLRLDEDLAAQSTQLRAAAGTAQPGTGLLLPPGQDYQLLDSRNRVLEAAPDLTGPSLLRPKELGAALRAPLREDRGNLFPISGRPLRILAVPLHSGAPPTGPAVALVAVRLDQRDEALRELIGQLALAHLAALAIASVVGYRLARAALTPVERYRTEAARIAAGATGVRVAVPAGSHDEVARLGRTLNDMLTALETALDRERRFVSDASHELRTPLTLLSTELQIALRRTRTPAEYEETLRRATADTHDLIALADTLLAVGTTHDPVAYARTRVDVTTLLEDLTGRYRSGGAMRLQAQPGLAAPGDAAQLRQVVTNLLDNAVRHGAGTITIDATRAETGVRIAVHDEGPGMEPAFLSRATERFARADTARTSPGTGLGLSLVETIVRGHGGQLLICSNGLHHLASDGGCAAADCTHPESGTTVTVVLPGGEPGRE
jgi:signal transduction histidine kinase